MKCPYCGYAESKVIDSRPADDGASIRRRRECLSCTKRFTTYETVESLPMEACGARLREVGTTNRTHLADYERAIGEETRALMKVHTSNFCVLGFTEAVPLADLVALGHERGLPVIEDLGSGSLWDLEQLGLHGNLLVIELPAVKIRRKLYILRRKNSILSPSAQVFYRFAEQFYHRNSEQ